MLSTIDYHEKNEGGGSEKLKPFISNQVSFLISFVERTILMFGAKLCINESHIQPRAFRFCLTTSNASYVLQCSFIDFLDSFQKPVKTYFESGHYTCSDAFSVG